MPYQQESSLSSLLDYDKSKRTNFGKIVKIEIFSWQYKSRQCYKNI